MKCNLIHQAPIWAIRLLSTICLLIAVVTPLQAANSVESNETHAVGRMPVLSAPYLPLGPIAMEATEPVSDKAIVGVPLTLADMGIDFAAHVLANFSDADGDNEGGSSYEWMIDNVVVETGSTFTPAEEHGGQLLSVRITPKTQTGDPDIGKVMLSNSIVVRSKIIERFSKPGQTRLDWNSANFHCSITLGNGGYRLPTKDELQQLYKETTIAMSTGDSNIQICQRYGWPLNGHCNGDNSYYWTSDPFSSLYYLIGMQDGNDSYMGVSFKGYVTCIN